MIDENQVLKKETKQEFVSRKMSEMKDEFPDEKQRLAVAYSKWDQAHKEGNMNSVMKSIRSDLHQIFKAEEGDKRTIFGRPSTFTGGNWVADEGGSTDEPKAQSTPTAQQMEEFAQDSAGYDPDVQPSAPLAEEKLNALRTDASVSIVEDLGSDMTDDEIIDLEDAIDGLDADQLQAVIDGDYSALNLPDGTSDPEDAEISLPEGYKQTTPKRTEPGGGWDSVQDEIDSRIAIIDRTIQNMDKFDKPGMEEAKNSMDQSINFQKKKLKELGVVKKSLQLHTVRKTLAGVHDMLRNYGVTCTTDMHSHSYLVDADGNGQTTGMIGTHGVEHVHDIKEFEVKPAQNHTHELI